MRAIPFGPGAPSGLPALITINKGLTTLNFHTARADTDFVIDGTTYKAAPGADLTGLECPSDGAAANADVTIIAEYGGILSPGDAARGVIDEWPITIELFDPANINAARYLVLDGTIVGSVDEDANGLVTIAANGLLRQAQEQPLCEHYSLVGREDLGDDRCKVPILLHQTQTFYDILRSTDYVRPDFEAGILTEFGLAHVTDAYGRVRIGTGGTIDDYSNVYFECQTAGTTGPDEPSWPTTPGNTVNDGSVVWICRNAWFRHGRAQALDAYTIQLSSFSDSRATADPSWFTDGGIFFRSGNLNGFRKFPIKSWDPGTSQLTLFLPVTPTDVPAGTQCEVHPGCDRTRGQCFTRFNNIINLRAETFVPPPDMIFSL
jgi:hypothetical protein